VAAGDALRALHGDRARRLSQFQRLPRLCVAGRFAGGGAGSVGCAGAQSRSEQSRRRGPGGSGRGDAARAGAAARAS
jgi:hypothetical protein